MGDISELRGLIVTIGFLSSIILLLIWLPHTEFAQSMIEARQYSSPEDFDISEIMAWNGTYRMTFNYSMDFPYHIEDEEIGHDLNLYVWTEAISLEHFWYWWLIPCNFHPMEWYDSDHHSKISDDFMYFDQEVEELDIETVDEYAYGSLFYAECEHLQLRVTFFYNTSEYSTHLEAHKDEALSMSVGVEWEIEKTTYNAWELVGMLLTFNLPLIHPLINALISIPIWACIAYLCYVLVIKVIPFIAGG